MKTYVRRKKSDKKVNEFDHFITPNSHPHQPRSSAVSKPRTDFSLFLCSNFNHQDLLPASAGSKEELSTLTESSPAEGKDTKADILDLPLAQWTQSHKKWKVVPSETPTLEVGSVSKSDVDLERTGTAGTLQFGPDKATIAISGDLCPTPGSVVWAKKSCQLWWPAEVLKVGSPLLALSSCTEGTGGLVLVHYYGSEESAWVDPARDLSPFEDCFEERSCNPVEEFQEAVKQAIIHQKEQLSSTKQLIASPEGDDRLNVHDQPHDSRGRSKRERKPKVHFDEVNIPWKSAKKVRRLKIMRSLGLAPPAGSPFAQSPMQQE